MNLDIKDISKISQPLLHFLKRFGITLTLLLFLAVYAFLVIRVNSFANVEPADDEVQAKVNTIARPRIDRGIIDTVTDFEQRNIETQTLFQQARNNPFAESE